MQQISIIGNIGSIERTTGLNGKEQLKLSVAVNEGKGEKERTDWYTVYTWQNHLEQYLTKGRKVFISGSLRLSAYIDKTQTAKANGTIYANTIEFIAGSQSGNAQRSDYQAQVQPQYYAPQAPQAPYVNSPYPQPDSFPQPEPSDGVIPF